MSTTTDTVFFLEQTGAPAELVPIAGGTAGVFSIRSPAKDTTNEDAAVLIPLGPTSAVLAVADGCGGMASGEVASRIAVQSLAQSVCAADSGSNLRVAILDGIETANRKICELGNGAATTLSVIEIDDGYVRPYHVGDSIILLSGNFGKIKLQTMSHSPVGYAVESGLMNERDALHHDERHIVSNVVGSDEMHIAVGSRRRLAKRDTLLLASDGLADNLSTPEIVELIRRGEQRKCVKGLVDAALARMGNSTAGKPSKPDDLTVIMFRPGK